MIEQNNSYQKHTAFFSDLTLCDVDIDFELNNGKGAWVVVLRKDGRPRQASTDIDEYE